MWGLIALGFQGQPVRALPQADSSCPPDYNPGAYLYTEANFAGTCFHTTTDIADLGQTPIGDNNLSSIQLRGWYVVKLYEHPNWQGQSLEIIVDDSNLDHELIGGKYSSLRIYPHLESNIVTDIHVSSGLNYYLTKCKKDSEYYLDRDFKLTDFTDDDYDGLWCIKTANNDKNNASREFLSFELNRPAAIYIYFDRRMKVPPSWVGSLFKQSAKKVYVSDNDMDYFVVYGCYSYPGVITLGGPMYEGGQGSKAMYVVAFRELWGEQFCNPISPPPTPTYTPLPPSTPTPTATPTPIPGRGDVNGDGQIDIFDLALVASRYGTNDPIADVNGDGVVDIFDLSLIAANYGWSSQ